MAISEAVEVAAKDPGAHYALGSVLNHVLLHQALIGQEVLVQLAAAGETQADIGSACAGGDSNLAGLTPLLKMYTLGKDFVPPAIHAGGLRYHGMSPMVSHAVNLGLMEAVAIEQAAEPPAPVERRRGAAAARAHRHRGAGPRAQGPRRPGPPPARVARRVEPR